MLCEALNAHPDLKCAMEIFNVRIGTGHYHGAWRSYQLQELYGGTAKQMTLTLPEGYEKFDESRFDLRPLLGRVFDTFNGFKLIHGQLDDSPVLRHLSEMPDLKVIFLDRDWLDRCLSFKLSNDSGAWIKRPGDAPAEDAPFVFPYADVRRFFDRYCPAEAHSRQLFGGCAAVTVGYDDLCYRWAEAVGRLQEFIGVERRDLPRLQCKRTLRRPRELIANYAELAARFAGGPYGRFFGGPKFL